MDPSLRRIEGFPAAHGFTLRTGGRSRGAYASLNLGDSVGDDPERVSANRRSLRDALGLPRHGIRSVRQVHGETIVDWTQAPFTPGEPPEADAHMSDDPAHVLAIAVADCLPILFHDPASGAVGAAHCGWRGTQRRLAGLVVGALERRFGSRPPDLSVAIGPGIAGTCYQVGAEVVDAFREAGFPPGVARPDAAGRFRLDLAAANRHALEAAGVEATRIFVDPACTHCDAERYFSYRRDGVTGRHWALVRPGAAGSMGNAASTRDHAAPARARRMSLGSGADA